MLRYGPSGAVAYTMQNSKPDCMVYAKARGAVGEVVSFIFWSKKCAEPSARRGHLLALHARCRKAGARAGAEAGEGGPVPYSSALGPEGLAGELPLGRRRGTPRTPPQCRSATASCPTIPAAAARDTPERLSGCPVCSPSVLSIVAKYLPIRKTHSPPPPPPPPAPTPGQSAVSNLAMYWGLIQRVIRAHYSLYWGLLRVLGTRTGAQCSQ